MAGTKMEEEEGTALVSGSRNGGFGAVSVDTPWEEVLVWNEKPNPIVWEESVTKFIVLTDEQVMELREINRQSYRYAKMAYEARLKASVAGDVVAQAIVSGGNAAPDARLRVRGIDQEKFATKWQRPEDVEHDILYGGYQVVQEPGVRSEANNAGVGGIHQISKNGVPELVLLKRPRAMQVKAEAAGLERRNRLLNQQQGKIDDIPRRAGMSLPGENGAVTWRSENSGEEGTTEGGSEGE